MSASDYLNLNAGHQIRFTNGNASYYFSTTGLGSHTIATTDMLSDYATISAVSSAISDLSSVYAPVGYLPSGVSGYASEVWTFTLSDNTSVSKTILVG